MSGNLKDLKRILCSQGDDWKWLIMNSPEANNFKESLLKLKATSNAPSYCAICHCFLNHDQRNSHSHAKKHIRTPANFCEWGDFCILIRENEHARLKDGIEEFKMIIERPLKTHQNVAVGEEKINLLAQDTRNEGLQQIPQDITSLKQYLNHNKDDLYKENLLLVSNKKPKSQKEEEKPEPKNEQDQSESKKEEEEEKAREPLLTIILDTLIEIGKEVTNSSKEHAAMTKTLSVIT